MNFDHLDFLIYSSHKTATQTLVNTITKHNYKTTHCHIISNFKMLGYEKITNKIPVTNETFIQGLIRYKNTHNKKLKIISVIRDPKDRLLSSFFQSYSTDEIYFLKKKIDNTTICIKSEEELCTFYENLIANKCLPGGKESIDEMSYIFGINIIEHLNKKEQYYYLNHELFELYVLDFNKIISLDNLTYLNNILKVNFINIFNDNVSDDKSYSHKYKNIKAMLGAKLHNLIETQYDSFYFTAFDNKKV